MKIRRSILITFAIAIWLVVFLLIFSVFAPMGTGSKRFANKWAKKFEFINTLEEAKTEYSWLKFRKFENGDWIFGVSSDSHSNPWGGTIVTKDSNGQIRCFFGHVCGSGFLRVIFTLTQPKTLDEIYNDKLKSFKEYKPE
ncbi:MAG: hypothetical protein KAI43_10495 [Candidatus Aureabacteria bacterium]|nr:hypothetical protein [Candidatus Auribacterota bacterium]